MTHPLAPQEQTNESLLFLQWLFARGKAAFQKDASAQWSQRMRPDNTPRGRAPWLVEACFDRDHKITLKSNGVNAHLVLGILEQLETTGKQTRKDIKAIDDFGAHIPLNDSSFAKNVSLIVVNYQSGLHVGWVSTTGIQFNFPDKAVLENITEQFPESSPTQQR